MTGLEWATLIIAGIGGITGLSSLWFTHLQWEKIKAKVTLLTNSEHAFEVVPAWYTSRMMTDDWLFGLLTSDGRMIAITRITAVSSDGKWMTVELAENDQLSSDLSKYGIPVTAVAQDRTKASVQIDSVVAAMDLQSS
jgi:hypothetical protein